MRRKAERDEGGGGIDEAIYQGPYCNPNLESEGGREGGREDGASGREVEEDSA